MINILKNCRPKEQSIGWSRLFKVDLVLVGVFVNDSKP